MSAAAESRPKGSAPSHRLATLSPIDSDLLESCQDGRLVIVHEAARIGRGAEIAAIVAEHGLYDLQAGTARDRYDTVVPLFRLEHDTSRACGASSTRSTHAAG